MFVRMLSAMIGAVPLGYVADRWGRKVVVVMHKVNVVVSCSAWLAFCEFTSFFIMAKMLINQIQICRFQKFQFGQFIFLVFRDFLVVILTWDLRCFLLVIRMLCLLRLRGLRCFS